MNTRLLRNSLLGTLLVGLCLIPLAAGLAQQSQGDAGIDGARGPLVDWDWTGMLEAAPPIAAASTYASGEPRFSVQVDQAYCSTGGVQCTGSGGPIAGNSDRVRITCQLQDPFAPVLGLTAANFDVSSPFIPAGGSGLVMNTSCTSCFQSTSEGVYAIFVEPATVWKSGMYHVQVKVTLGGLSLRALAAIEIP